MKTTLLNKISDFFVDYFSLSGQLVSQSEAEANIREGVSFRGSSILILIMAILIASLGLNTNSTAVIIGAMLISPLMGPIIGIGLGVGIHDFGLIKRALRNLIMAALFSVIASTIYFLISPVNEQHSELLARTSPTIYDVLIAFVGGGAGILALGSTNKGNVLPGVAIATALMPPLCTAGYGLATLQFNYFFGASYLFVINSIYIAFSTYIGVKLMKYKAVATEDNVRARRVRRIVYIAAILTMLPSIWLTYRMLTESRFTIHADQFIADECRWDGTQVISRKIYTQDGRKYLSITLLGRQLPADSLEQALSAKLKFYGLEGTHLTFIQGGYSAPQRTETQSVAEIYRVAQQTISEQQHHIDSLQTLLTDTRSAVNDAPAVSPEVHVLFPRIKHIGIATTVCSRPADSTVCDTVTFAIISPSGSLSHSDSERLANFLSARLHLNNIRVIEVPDSDFKD